MWLSAGSRDEAEALRRAEVDRLRRGMLDTAETVGGYVTTWLSTLDVGPGTWPTYRGHVTERIVPTLGSVALVDLTPAMVRSATIGWTGAPATRAGTLRLLRAAMTQAVADRLIGHDPTAGIPYPRIVAREPVTLDAAQARRLIAAVRGERWGPIVVVSLGMGLRRGEALGLRTQDVDLAAGTVTISRSLRYIPPALRAPGEDRYRLTGTKTGETRVVPLPAFVAESLRLRLAEREGEQRAAKVWAPNDLVFCDVRGNNVPLNSLHDWWGRMLAKAGLPAVRWHSMRASCITVLLDMGVDLLTIQRIVGHKDLATTRRYVGQTPVAMGSAADRLDEAMGG